MGTEVRCLSDDEEGEGAEPLAATLVDLQLEGAARVAGGSPAHFYTWCSVQVLLLHLAPPPAPGTPTCTCHLCTGLHQPGQAEGAVWRLWGGEWCVVGGGWWVVGGG